MLTDKRAGYIAYFTPIQASFWLQNNPLLDAHCYWSIKQKKGTVFSWVPPKREKKKKKENQKCFVEKSALLPKTEGFCVDNLLLAVIWAVFFYMNKWKQRSGRDQTLVGPGISTGVLHHDWFITNLQIFLQHKAPGLPEMFKSFTRVDCYSRRSLPLLILQIRPPLRHPSTLEPFSGVLLQPENSCLPSSYCN